MNSNSVNELNRTATTTVAAAAPKAHKKHMNCNVKQRRQTRKLYSHRSCVHCIFLSFILFYYYFCSAFRDGINYYASFARPTYTLTCLYGTRVHIHSMCVHVHCDFVTRSIYDHLLALCSSFNRIRIFLSVWLPHSRSVFLNTTPSGVLLPFMQHVRFSFQFFSSVISIKYYVV